MTCARLLDPAGARAHRPQRCRTRIVRELARRPRRGRRSRALDTQQPRRAARRRAAPRATTAPRGRGTREPGATRARCLDLDGTRAHTSPATTGSTCPSGRGGESRPAKPRARRDNRIVVRREIDDGAVRARQTREPGATAGGSSIPVARAPARARRRAARIVRVGASAAARPARPLLGERRTARAQ